MTNSLYMPAAVFIKLHKVGFHEIIKRLYITGFGDILDNIKESNAVNHLQLFDIPLHVIFRPLSYSSSI